MLLSDRFLGFFMVPAESSWNYNFMGNDSMFDHFSDFFLPTLFSHFVLMLKMLSIFISLPSLSVQQTDPFKRTTEN